MHIYLNGEAFPFFSGTSLGNFLQLSGFADTKGIAVAVNNQVVPRTQWGDHALVPEDQVLVISATQGG